MGKGVSAHQNIALLRHCGGVALQAFWNILYGFPGECAEDYAAVIALMPKLHHLYPPASCTCIVIDRYSPYFADPEGTGVAPIVPQTAYRCLYPDEVPVADVAYHFVGDYRTELLDQPALVERLRAAIADWRRSWGDGKAPVLQLFERDGQGLVLDTRAIAHQPVTRLTTAQHAALLDLRKPKARRGLDPALAAEAEWLLDQGFAIDHEDILMSVVVHPRHEVAARRACGGQVFE